MSITKLGMFCAVVLFGVVPIGFIIESGKINLTDIFVLGPSALFVLLLLVVHGFLALIVLSRGIRALKNRN